MVYVVLFVQCEHRNDVYNSIQSFYTNFENLFINFVAYKLTSFYRFIYQLMQFYSGSFNKPPVYTFKYLMLAVRGMRVFFPILMKQISKSY
jgi:hypothetical protein